MLQLQGKKVAVTGSSSMIGRAVLRSLDKRGALIREVPHKIYDLTIPNNAADVVYNVDYCIHCAGYNGNIAFNANYPADIYYRTSVMGLNILNACKTYDVKKIVIPLASCAYPDKDILYEWEFDKGPPNKTVEAHGLAKRAIFDYARQLYKQHQYNAVSIIFNTCYGPYDSFDVDKTKVVGGLINKFSAAQRDKLPYVECWGSGKVRREFIYCDDAAEALVQALEKYDDPTQVLNVGTGNDTEVRYLAKIISELVGYGGEIIWNTDKPDGQYRKLLISDRMKEYIDIEFTTLKDGLSKTINWYREQV